MSERYGDNTPVVKVELKRADAYELVKSDKVLARCPVVTALGAGLQAVLAKAIVRRYPDKVVIFQQGETGSGLYLVLAGEVRLFARKQADAVELGMVRKGDVLGEGEVLSGDAVRTSSAVAQGVVDLAELPREALLVNGKLTHDLEQALKAIHQARAQALDEMTDFLNRW
ncbi:MAG: cyclic nucleotide-binding domain-containing protein [Myxococcota bacterium]